MKKIIILSILLAFWACDDELDLKPKSSVVLPETVDDLERLLNNEQLAWTSLLTLNSSDEYFIPTMEDWQSTFFVRTRNAAIWKPDIYEGETIIDDWNIPYQTIFYCNSVLDVFKEQDITEDPDKLRLKGWALFLRAYSFYDLVSVFSKAYNQETANTDLGIPIRLTAGIDEVFQRSTLQETYDRIIGDILEASELLPMEILDGKRNHPSKIAAYAFLARVYLSMRKYDLAEVYADKSLQIYPILTDFNTLDPDAARPFTFNAEETIYYSRANNADSFSRMALTTTYGVNVDLMESYDPFDLRRQIYFQINTIGNYNMKPINSLSTGPFTGLATDEIYLIKAECLARRGETEEAMEILNQLLSTRWDTEAGIYQDKHAENATEALDMILTERKRALIWRGLRWTDLKRLNLEGYNITISRKVGDEIYTLAPNSPLYVLPIPNDEVALSGIEQNPR
jgi:tetratricopeptide (TPR) repeat protein